MYASGGNEFHVNMSSFPPFAAVQARRNRPCSNSAAAAAISSDGLLDSFGLQVSLSSVPYAEGFGMLSALLPDFFV